MKISEIITSSILKTKTEEVCGAVKTVDPCEYQYAMKYLLSFFKENDTIIIPEKTELEQKIKNPDFYRNIQLKPRDNSEIILDKTITELTLMIFGGIVSNKYDTDWIRKLFYFDVRGFIFIPRTIYFTPAVLENLQKKPYMEFSKNQSIFENFQGIGYEDFRTANQEIDKSLISLINKILLKTGSPAVIGIAGQTAAGKTEISEYLRKEVLKQGKDVKSVEMDNFFLDRDYRESKGITSMEKASLHFSNLKESLAKLKEGINCEIPRYDQLTGKSSHNTEGKLKSGGNPVKIKPADIIYLEGNFPFLFKEISPLIDLKIMYLTDDPVRLKRKWKRDIDYRKKYNPRYLCNRYFRTQFLKAETVYISQLEICDIAVDTTAGRIWLNRKTEKILAS